MAAKKGKKNDAIKPVTGPGPSKGLKGPVGFQIPTKKGKKK